MHNNFPNWQNANGQPQYQQNVQLTQTFNIAYPPPLQLGIPYGVNVPQYGIAPSPPTLLPWPNYQDFGLAPPPLQTPTPSYHVGVPMFVPQSPFQQPVAFPMNPFASPGGFVQLAPTVAPPVNLSPRDVETAPGTSTALPTVQNAVTIATGSPTSETKNSSSVQNEPTSVSEKPVTSSNVVNDFSSDVHSTTTSETVSETIQHSTPPAVQEIVSQSFEEKEQCTHQSVQSDDVATTDTVQERKETLGTKRSNEEKSEESMEIKKMKSSPAIVDLSRERKEDVKMISTSPSNSSQNLSESTPEDVDHSQIFQSMSTSDVKQPDASTSPSMHPSSSDQDIPSPASSFGTPEEEQNADEHEEVEIHSIDDAQSVKKAKISKGSRRNSNRDRDYVKPKRARKRAKKTKKERTKEYKDRVGRMNEKRKANFRNESVKWVLLQDLKHAMNHMDHGHDDEAINKVRAYIKQQEKNVKPVYLQCRVDFDAKFPDKGNYRRCETYLEMNCLRSVVLKPRKQNKKVGTFVAPPSSLYGDLHVDLLELDSAGIQNAVDQTVASGQNHLWKTNQQFVRPEPDRRLAEEEREMYRKDYNMQELDKLTGADCLRIPTPMIEVKSKEDFEDPRFEKFINQASITCVTGVGKALGIDAKKFSLNVIASLHPDLEIDSFYQNPQTADSNKTTEGEVSWRTSGIQTSTTISAYATYMTRRQNKCLEMLNEMIRSTDLAATDGELCKKLIKEQEVQEEMDPTMFWSRFGTNIDLQHSTCKFPDQMKELLKLPTLLRPAFIKNLLNMIHEDVLGINTVQVYSKPPGSRTAAHMENSLLGSINWNVGPGSCVWFAVPYEYYGEIEKIVKERQLKYHLQNYWPDEEELLSVGIPVQKFIQGPDALVYVNTGCFHWVQSLGYCVNVSWNVGQANFVQLATSMLAQHHNVISKYECHVPIIDIAWQIADLKLFTHDEKMCQVVKSILARSLGHNLMYLEELRQKGHEVVEQDDLEFWVPNIIRCDQCRSEVFNIVKWYLGNEELVSSTFCDRCVPKEEFTNGRIISYSQRYPMDLLKQIFDEFNYDPNAKRLETTEEEEINFFMDPEERKKPRRRLYC